MDKRALTTTQREAARTYDDGACQMCGRQQHDHTSDCLVPFLEEWVAAAQDEEMSLKDR